MMRNLLRALVGAVVLLLFATIPVLGHAVLVESDPVEDGTITTPYTMTATFSEELLERSNIVVDNSAGDEVARGEPDPADPATIVVELPELPAGTYVARWTARTADGHTERAEIHFTVVAPVTPPPPTSTPTASPSSGPTTAPTTAAPTTSAPATLPPSGSPTTAAPTTSAAPSSSPAPVDPGTGGGGGDAVVAVAIGAVVIGAIALFLFARRPR